MSFKAKNPQRLPSGDIHPAHVKAALAVRGITLTKLAQRHRKDPSYFRVALKAPFAGAMRILARTLECPANELWPTLFDEQDTPIKARQRPASTARVSTNERNRSHREAA